MSDARSTKSANFPPDSKRSYISERAELVGFFTDKINSERKGTKFPRIRAAAINKKLAKRYPTKSLHPLYALKSSCLDAEKRRIPFSAAFWKRVNRKETIQSLSPKKSA